MSHEDNEHPLPAEIRSIPDRPSVRFRSEYEDVVATTLLRMIAREAMGWPALAAALVKAEQESRLDMIELIQIWEDWYYSVHQTPCSHARIDEIVRSLKSALGQET